MEQTLNHLKDISAFANILEDWKNMRKTGSLIV